MTNAARVFCPAPWAYQIPCPAACGGVIDSDAGYQWKACANWKGVYLENPELLAENQEEYPEISSQKGLLLDPAMLGKETLTDLGVEHAIYNIPLSIIMGKTTNQDYPTIIYEYDGKDYAFNGALVNSYDGLFAYLTSQGMCTTAVVLNDWNENFTQMIHPGARNRDSGALYYMFNTEEGEASTRRGIIWILRILHIMQKSSRRLFGFFIRQFLAGQNKI